MLKILFAMLSALMLVSTCFCVAVEPAGRADEAPRIVIEGLEAYKNFGFQAAFGSWLKGSPIDGDNGTKSALLETGSQAEQAYGKMVGYEFIRVTPISPSIKRVYVALLFEKSPLYATLDCYHTSHGWVVSQMDASTKPPTERPISSESR